MLVGTRGTNMPRTKKGPKGSGANHLLSDPGGHPAGYGVFAPKTHQDDLGVFLLPAVSAKPQKTFSAKKYMLLDRRRPCLCVCIRNAAPAKSVVTKALLAVMIALGILHGAAVQASARDAEINGLVIDQTQTRVGAEFYRLFTLFWELPRIEENPRVSIMVVERASAQWGFWILILVNDNVAFQSVMKPQPDDIERDVRMAVSAVQQHIVALSRGNQVLDPDISGSGI